MTVKMLVPQVIGNRIIMVTPMKACEIRAKIQARQARMTTISQELNRSGLLPRGPGSQIAGWLGNVERVQENIKRYGLPNPVHGLAL